MEREKLDNVVLEQSIEDENETMADVEVDTLVVRDKAEWIADKLLLYGAYDTIDVSVKAKILEFDIANVSEDIRLFSDDMRKPGIKLAGNELYEEFQRIYDESVSRDVRDVCVEKVEDKRWNRGRGR